MKKTMTWTVLGPVDKFFGFIFGFFKGYTYFIVLYSVINFIHPLIDGVIILIKENS